MSPVYYFATCIDTFGLLKGLDFLTWRITRLSSSGCLSRFWFKSCNPLVQEEVVLEAFGAAILGLCPGTPDSILDYES